MVWRSNHLQVLVVTTHVGVPEDFYGAKVIGSWRWEFISWEIVFLIKYLCTLRALVAAFWLHWFNNLYHNLVCSLSKVIIGMIWMWLLTVFHAPGIKLYLCHLLWVHVFLRRWRTSSLISFMHHLLESWWGFLSICIFLQSHIAFPYL